MATLKQIEAARRNGAKSRGPVTEEGKARSRYNGTKHGIYAKCVVLNNEDHDAWGLTVEQAVAAWKPADDRELRLATDIANANWRIDRLSAYEVAALDLEIDRMRPEIDQAFEEIDEITRSAVAFNSMVVNNQTLQTVQSALRTQFRLRDRAITLLLRLRKERKAEERETSDTAAPCAADEALPTPGTPEASQPAMPEPAPATIMQSAPAGTPNVANIENRRSEPNAIPQTGVVRMPAHMQDLFDLSELCAI